MKSILKIAYFINQYPKVSHTFIRREILALERQGFDVQRIALRGWSETTPDPVDRQEQARTRYILRQGVWGLVLPVVRAIITSPMRLFSALSLAIRVSRRSDRRILRHLVCVAEACVVQWLRESKASRLHAHFGTNSAEVGMYAHSLGGPPYSFTVHGPEEFESPMGLAEKVGDSAFVAAISSYGRSQLYLRCTATEWPKVQVVRCGIEPRFTRSAAIAAPRSRRLICVGRLCEAKGQISWSRRWPVCVPRGWTWIWSWPAMGRCAEKLKPPLNVTAWRHRANNRMDSSDGVRDEILASRALVLPSFAEGLPVVIMEAMALRRPVLSTYVAGIPELVRAGENGWLFPAGSLEELMGAMEDCLSRSGEEIRRMGDAGHERVINVIRSM